MDSSASDLLTVIHRKRSLRGEQCTDAKIKPSLYKYEHNIQKDVLTLRQKQRQALSQGEF